MQKLLGIEKELYEEEAKSMELSAEVCMLYSVGHDIIDELIKIEHQT